MGHPDLSGSEFKQDWGICRGVSRHFELRERPTQSPSVVPRGQTTISPRPHRVVAVDLHQANSGTCSLAVLPKVAGQIGSVVIWRRA